MATLSILHVGEDICYRVPVMEHAGLIVAQSACSVDALQNALSGGNQFGGIVFQSETDSHFTAVVSEARTLSPAPLILFEDTATCCDENFFDLVIPAQTPPAVWLKSLNEAIEDARELRERSKPLRQDCAIIRSISGEFRH